MGQPFDDGLKIRFDVAPPMAQRVHSPPWPQRAIMPRVAHVHRLVLDRDLEETAQKRQSVRTTFHAFGRDGEDDVVVAKAFGVAETVQSIGHTFAISFSGSTLTETARP